MSGMHIACMHVCMHGAHALNEYGVPKYPSGLACMQADSNLGKITASLFWVLNAQMQTRTCQT